MPVSSFFPLTFTVLSRRAGETVGDGVAAVDGVVGAPGTGILVGVGGPCGAVVARGTFLLGKGRGILHTVVPGGTVRATRLAGVIATNRHLTHLNTGTYYT
jgi:hypothetical protein